MLVTALSLVLAIILFMLAWSFYRIQAPSPRLPMEPALKSASHIYIHDPSYPRIDERTSINLSPQFVANFEGNPTIRLVWARSLSGPNRLLDGVFAPALGGGILGLEFRLGHLLLVSLWT